MTAQKTSQAIFVPWLHMHQPPIWKNNQLMGNLEKMLAGEENSEEQWNAQWFALAYKNPARYVAQLSAEGHHPRIMVDYSGVLLEEMALLSQNGIFNNTYVEGEAIGDVINLFRQVLAQYPREIEFAGTAYSHCYFPATPARDHEAQIKEWRRVFANLFGEAALKKVRGFWLPEMGMTGDPQAALQLIRLLKKYGYQWLILPRAAVEHPEGWNTPLLENRVHTLVVEAGGDTESILCVIRDTDMGIRQQSGQNADGCVNEIRYRHGVFKNLKIDIPPLIVPTSDGENGNVMMFEFFPNTFAPLFRNSQNWPDIAFMTISEYIDKFLPNGATTQIKLKLDGGSWIGGHHSWFEGDERRDILQQVEAFSGQWEQMKQEKQWSQEKIQEIERSLLLCETSCFVYWNSPFWFEQARHSLAWGREKLESLLVS